ncbi:MAG TPA: 1-deoxy-D-xylulose-5-phosphate synthase [Tepidisphaeraceae bacterium]|jgi:1-deoxy-D-xylulose-5-phosphate synthase
MTLLDSIQQPRDIKKLSLEELTTLSGEMRRRIFEAVSVNGGHLASNLGVVELTLALHYVYDFGPHPHGPDRLLFDVGHQCYPHKLLTGRGGEFPTLRKKNSVSGFPSPEESPYDLFAVGHAGTAISTAVGVARADQHMGRDSHVVAIVGDASIVNGMAFEGLNNAGTLKRQLLVILNDNGMSISKPQGAFAQYLERVRISTTYDEAKRLAEKVIGKLPTSVASTVEAVWHHVKEGVKSTLWPGQLFESLGIKYMGPIDGHDLPGMIEMLAELKHVNAPVLLHVTTQKGRGYEACLNEPTKFHSPAPFSVNGCRLEINKSTGKSWTVAFADAMIELAKQDKRIIALTAAMPDGTGLSKFEKELPGQYYDTGICESHLAAMAAGMSKMGMKPVAAIYSTFTQRCYDQIWQEISLNQLPVIFAMDRAGFVGDDGAVHHGFMDQAFLRPMPGMVLMAPSDESELKRCLKFAMTLDTASALRYPRDTVPAKNFEEIIEDAPLRLAAQADWELGKSRVIRQGEDVTLIVYGALIQTALEVANQLAASGVDVEVIDARFCKPVDGSMLSRVLNSGHPVFTIEDHSLQNGFGSSVLEYAQSHSLPIENLHRLGHPDRLVSHATRKEQLAEVGLDAAGIIRAIQQQLRPAPVMRTIAAR